MRTLLAVAVAVLLSGCATWMQPDPGLTPDQLKAISADKNASAVCSQVIGAWGTARIVSVNLDKTVFKTGQVQVDTDCKVNVMSNDPIAAPAARVPISGCAGDSLSRNPDTGGCSVISRDSECRVNSVRAVPAEQCAALKP